MKKIIPIAVIVSIVIIATLVALRSQRQSLPPILSPKSSSNLTTKHIIGFLPYWQATSANSSRFTLLDEVVYFGLHITEEGEIATRDSDGNRDQGYARFAQTIDKLEPVSLAIILQDNEKVEKFLESKPAQEKLISSVSSLITQHPELTGINLDFEYSGIPGKETIASYSSFVRDLSHKLKTHHPELVVSVDITADAMRKSRLYDVAELAKSVDYVVLMGYDFHRPSSSVAGPVAPLTGKEIYEYDVTTAVADFLNVVPKEKLILGVPYYGWDFPTESEERGSFVEKRPDEAVALSSYKRNRRLMEERGLDVRFDKESQTPWMVYRDPDTNGIRQVWFENEVSLGKKYDLVNERSLAGIAIWALGYDGDHDELWNLLKEKFER